MEIVEIKTVDVMTLQHFVDLEEDSFGIGGLNAWTLMPLIRYGRVYAAYENGTVIGLIQYMRDWDKPERVYMVGVSMAKEVRGRGYGTAFITGTLRMLAHDCKEVELTVAPENLAAVRIYEKLGFTANKIRKDEYGKGEDRIVMLLAF